MSLKDKLAERRSKKFHIGKLMKRFASRKEWAKWKNARKRRLAQVNAIDKLLKLIKRRNDWPESMVIEELFINDNGMRNHVHVASRDRDALIQLGRIAQEKYSGGDTECVREFPPFDTVECVHTGTSWHYRDESNPDAPRTCPNIGNGLAFDLRSTPREAFAQELKRRYTVVRSDF